MNISDLKQAIQLCRKAKVTPWIWGHKGMGKSSLVRQLADSLGIGFIDFRCSQIEHSDLRGLPEKSNGMTRYLPPSDLPREVIVGTEYATNVINDFETNYEGDNDNFDKDLTAYIEKRNNGILLLDELNRAEDDVIQAAFQLALDRKIGEYSLPEGWSIVVAGNYPQGYMTNNFNDPAFIDRFCHLEIASSEDYLTEWAKYMQEYPATNKILQYVGVNLDSLCGATKGQLDFVIEPSPRSWEIVARVEQHAHEYSQQVVREVRAGLIGVSHARSFEQFNCKVEPVRILKEGADAVKGQSFNRSELGGLIYGVLSYITGKENSDTINNIIEFMRWLIKRKDEKDLAVVFGIQLIKKECPDPKLAAACFSNPHMSKTVYEHSGGKFLKIICGDDKLKKIMTDVSWG